MSELPRTKKTLGQHWLTDHHALTTITDTAELTKDDTVLEIGPGIGSLTAILAEKVKKVVAVEYDEPLALQLAARYANTNVLIVPEDILQFDLNQLSKGYKVVANIPYYLTGNLLRKLCEAENPPKSMTLLVQKEVAQRITAKPGSMSILAVTVQFYTQVRAGEVIPAHLFTPPPKVDSQIVCLEWRKEPLFNVDTKVFFKLVKAGFSERRKKLRSSLSGGLAISKDQAEVLLKQANINPEKRAQQLSLDDWYRLYNTQK